jgi:2-polyprenyl-3-methyl-5-hydroxy-6-metoxy-1,4-benzoquinol methylase
MLGQGCPCNGFGWPCDEAKCLLTSLTEGATMEVTMLDEGHLQQFVQKMLGDLGGATSIALVRIGHSLGLYKALEGAGPMTSAEFASKANIAERYAREWLSHQAASGYITYEPAYDTFELPPEQAMVFANENSPFFMMGAFDVAAAMIENQVEVGTAFKTGKGIAWGKQAGCLFCATGKMLRPRYAANIVSNWLPALDGVVPKLQRGASVADVGCGTGFSTVFMAKAFPKSNFIGYDFHPGSLEQAAAHAQEHGVSANTRFEVATAKEYAAKNLDLVTFFDVLHDLGDPPGAAEHVFRSLKSDGTWMLMEPIAGDHLEQNLHPIGRLAYGFSTMICVPTSLSQEVGMALGAQAGEGRLTDVIKSGGFTRVRRAAETPFNMVLEAKK